MKLTVLGSSSSGNCYILESSGRKILLECGVPFRDIQKALNFEFSDVCFSLVSHDHKDHCKAIADVANAGIEVYSSRETYRALGITRGHRYCCVCPGEQIPLSNFIVIPFKLQHDAADPLGYLIYDVNTKEKILFATDTFYIHNRFKDVNYIAVECNYMPATLEQNIKAGLVPVEMKERLVKSHFSLDNVKKFLLMNVSPATRKIILLHLSDNNSDAARMKAEIQELTGVETVVADQGLAFELNMFPF